MNLVKFRVGSELSLNERSVIMIDKSLLVSKSQYFAALLDGPLQARENEDGSIDLHEEDLATLAQLFYVIQSSNVSLLAKSDEILRMKLDSMAGFYLVDLPKRIEPPRLRTFKSREQINFANAETAENFPGFLSCLDGKMSVELFGKTNAKGLPMLVQVYVAKDLECVYLLHAFHTDHDHYYMHFVTEKTTGELERSHTGFGDHFQEL